MTAVWGWLSSKAVDVRKSLKYFYCLAVSKAAQQRSICGCDCVRLLCYTLVLVVA